MEKGYIYLLREREFLLRNEDVYKIGSTIQKKPSLRIDRFNKYKKGSQILCLCCCESSNVRGIEKNLIKKFDRI
jgi:hypothetical protein